MADLATKAKDKDAQSGDSAEPVKKLAATMYDKASTLLYDEATTLARPFISLAKQVRDTVTSAIAGQDSSPKAAVAEQTRSDGKKVAASAKHVENGILPDTQILTKPNAGQDQKLANTKILTDQNAGTDQKFQAIKNLFDARTSSVEIVDKDNKKRTYRLEVEKSETKNLVQLFGTDESGKERVVMRAVEEGHGKFSQQQDGNGNKVSFYGTRWSEKMKDKSLFAPPDSAIVPSSSPEAAPVAKPAPAALVPHKEDQDSLQVRKTKHESIRQGSQSIGQAVMEEAGRANLKSSGSVGRINAEHPGQTARTNIEARGTAAHTRTENQTATVPASTENQEHAIRKNAQASGPATRTNTESKEQATRLSPEVQATTTTTAAPAPRQEVLIPDEIRRPVEIPNQELPDDRASLASRTAFGSALAKRGVDINFVSPPNDPTARRILQEYGAMFAADNVTLPPKAVLTRQQTELYQSQIKPESVRLGNRTVELQPTAAQALRQARQDADQAGVSLNADGGPTPARRNYGDTVALWKGRVANGLSHWRNEIDNHERERIYSLPLKEQVPAILQLEKNDQLYFSTDFKKTILHSVAAPGTSQHLSMLALDVKEHDNYRVRQILQNNGFYQTVPSDQPHFTYLGKLNDQQLQARGLTRVVRGGRQFWIPNLPKNFDR